MEKLKRGNGKGRAHDFLLRIRPSHHPSLGHRLPFSRCERRDRPPAGQRSVVCAITCRPGFIPRNPPHPSLPQSGLPGGRAARGGCRRGKGPPAEVGDAAGRAGTGRGGCRTESHPPGSAGSRCRTLRTWPRDAASALPAPARAAPADGVTAPRPSRAGCRDPWAAPPRCGARLLGGLCSLRLRCLYKLVQRTNEKFQRPLGRAAVGGDRGRAS